MEETPESILSVDIEVPTQTRFLALIGNIAEQIGKDLADAAGDTDTLAYHLNLVLTEAAANAIQHGLPDQPGSTIRISIGLEDKDLVVRVYDHGQGFDLEAVPAPNFADLNERGPGIFFIRTFMDSVDSRKAEGSNVLEMRKASIRTAPAHHVLA
ncbi:ATP-binding protein [Methylocystis echinoides]|uniref:Anti-sigma factor n=1 Tax=Methylocystis echinoides TaxID=29468 RepID=A0A9W6GYN1_9HYPH|nr:ATP-binding protein [Methylocystis echinoides]GLI95402.1 anti-sigma factor [Methylocystis echinoides]